MAITDYRLDPFSNVINIKKITNESHKIPTSSPYIIRLNEIPQKTDPSTLSVRYDDGQHLTEVAAFPAQGQYWPDYNTNSHGIDDWNTGTLQFNAADAGRTVLVNYNGTGTLVDERLGDMLEIPFTTSAQPEREVYFTGTPVSCDSYSVSGSGNAGYTNRIRLKQHRGLIAGTYTLREVIQQLINRSQTFEFISEQIRVNCNCDCSDDM